MAQAVLSRRSQSQLAFLQRIDLTLVGATVVLAVLGAISVYAATKVPLAQAGISPTYDLVRQSLFDFLGLLAMAVVVAIGYRVWLQLAWVLYGLLIVALLGVLAIGHSALGSARWIQVGPLSLQPSAFGSTTLALVTTSLLLKFGDRLRFRHVALVILAALPALALVYKQPDLGSALLMVVVVAGVLLVGGLRFRQFIVLVIAAVAVGFVAVHFGLLHSYQLSRLVGFLHQDQKSLANSAAYQVTQSKAAISGGGLAGEGLFHGKLTNLGYLPEQDTDFVFATVSEQLGFLGSATLLAIYAVICWRLWLISVRAADRAGRLIAVGALCLIAYSVFQNVGMNMGLMPIAGIPLPLVSYGGSAILNTFVAVGLALSVGIESRR
jgi:rod shape determining protein RodA